MQIHCRLDSIQHYNLLWIKEVNLCSTSGSNIEYQPGARGYELRSAVWHACGHYRTIGGPEPGEGLAVESLEVGKWEDGKGE